MIADMRVEKGASDHDVGSAELQENNPVFSFLHACLVGFTQGMSLVNATIEPIYPMNQRFRKGVGGRGLAANSAQNTAKIVLQNCVLPLIRGGIGKRVQRKA